MKFVTNCLEPKILRNPYTHELVQVPCGHCDACRSKRAFAWSQRIEHECLSQTYSLFFTLTYNEDCVPKLTHYMRDTINVYVYDGEDKRHSPFIRGEYVDLSNLHLSRKEVNYILDSPKLRVLSKRHIQLFIKRLRRYINYHYGKDVQIRYFVCGEYGPSTYRPHYHGILWFSDKRIAAEIEKIISACWSYGYIDASFVCKSASSYVASYVNCFAYLPKVYTSNSLIRPFCLCSKRPPIGSYYFDVAKISENVMVSNPYFLGVRRCGEQLVSIPNWRFIEDSLFPKCPRFDKLDNIGRVAVYGLSTFSLCEEKYTFKAWCKNQISKYDTNLTRYLQQVGLTPEGTVLTREDLHRELGIAQRLLAVSKRVKYLCDFHGFDLLDYIKIIDNYYYKKEQYRLSNWYRFQQQFVEDGGDVKDLIYSDLAFLKRVVSPNSLKLIFESYGFDKIPSSLDFSSDLTETKNFKIMENFYNKLVHDSHKVKKANDKFSLLDNPLHYAQYQYRFN